MIPELFPVEDQTPLQSLPPVTEAPCTQEQAEFERHVEPRQAIPGIELSARYIVDGKWTFRDQAQYLVDTGAGPIIDFFCATRIESAPHDGEDNGVE